MLSTSSYLFCFFRHHLQSRRLVLFLALGVVSVLLVACGLVSGKPSTSAPNGFDDPHELQQACAERQRAINEWEQDELEKLAEKWADGEITLLRGAMEGEKIEEEATSMRLELEDACQEKEKELLASAQEGPNEPKARMRLRSPTNTPGPATVPAFVAPTWTPEPTKIPEPTWTPAPTFTPEPTWTPEPSPTPTATPLPTPTMTLQELAQTNSVQCVGKFSNYTGERVSVGNDMPYEAITLEDGSAYVKAGYFSVLYMDHNGEPHFKYWRYLPGPVRGTFDCREIGYDEYPTPTPVATKGEARIKQVAAIAAEVCRTWTYEWEERKTFFDGDGRFHLEEIRPLNEFYALGRARHLIGHQPANIFKRGVDWHRGADRYLIYSVEDNTCRETGVSARAWNTWPEVVPELESAR